MRKEYRFDYSRAKPNRFAEKMSKDVVAVVLEPDVAAVFKSSEAVNALLRSVIAALPAPKHQVG
jgi:translation elongation factor EF-4